MTAKRILEILVVGGVWLIPCVVLVVANSTFFPYVFAKNITFRVLVDIIAVSWVALMCIDTSYRPRWSAVLISVASFVGIVALADIFGENPLKSIFSNYERMEGLITLVHLMLYTFVAAAVFVREKTALWFWRISVAVAVYVSLYAIAQALLTDTFRLDATLGNPIYLAVYALFHIFIALVLSLRDSVGQTEKWLLWATVPLQTWVLFMTATRGASIGLVLGLLVTALGLLYTYRQNAVVRKVSIGLIAVVVIACGTLFVLKDASLVQESRVLKRFVTISLTEGTVFARTVVWGMAWEGVKEKPLLGWGQENFNLVFNAHYDPRMYAQEPWFDRTHNAVLDWLIAAGVLGLLAYISLYLALLWVLYKTHAFNGVQKWLLTGLLVAYGFHNLTVFDQIVSYILFFSLIAWIHAQSGEIHMREMWAWMGTVSSRMWQWVLVCGVVVVTTALVFALHARPVFANLSLIAGLQEASRARIAAENGTEEQARLHASNALTHLVEAESFGTYGTQEVREHLAQVASRFAAVSWMPSQEQDRWLDVAERGLSAQEVSAPGDARFPAFLGALYTAFGEHEKAHDAYLRAHAISPEKQTILIELAANALSRTDDAAALAYIEEAYALEPNYTTAAVFYAIRLIHEGELARFDDIFGDATYLGKDSRVLTALVSAGAHDRAVMFWERAFTESLDPRFAFVLARIYVAAEESERAIAVVRRVSAIDPRAQQEVEKIIEAIQNETIEN